MNTSIVVAAIALVGTVVGGWFTYRAATRAADATAAVEQEATAVSGYRDLVKDLRAEVDRLNKSITAIGRVQEDCQTRIGILEKERARDRALIRALVEYAHELRHHMKMHRVPIPEMRNGWDLKDFDDK